MLPEDYYQKNKVIVLPIKYGLGHPVIGHPVQNVMDPADATKVKKQINCMTCHQPHSSGAGRPAGERSGQQHGVLRYLP